MRKQKGVALIVSLWALALLSVLVGGVVTAVRLENQQSAYELRRSHALISAEAGLALAVESLLSSHLAGFVADGRDNVLMFDSVKLNISMRSERGKLDVNFADVHSIERLLRYLGAAPDQASQLGEQLQNLRSARQTIKVVEQLQTLPSMDATLYARLEPNVTLWSGLIWPDAAFATTDIRAALALPNSLINSNPGNIVSVRSQAQLTDGFSASVQVTLYLAPNGEGPQLYRVLRWQE